MKKIKLLNATFATILSTTSLVGATASLSSCSNSVENNIINDYNQFDNENNFDQKWFDSFVQSYKQQIINQAIETSPVSADAKKAEIESLNTTINTFKTNLQELLKDPNTKNFAYTVTSNAMIEMAQQLYSYNGQPIRITRSCNTTLNDVRNMFNNMAQSCEINMVNNGLDRGYIDNAMAQSKELCEKKLSSLCQAYADPAMIMMKAKQALPALFAGANEQIGLLGAQEALRDFQENFYVEYDTVKGARFDELVSANGEGIEITDADGKKVKFAVGNDVSAFVNKIFKIRNVKTNKIVKFNRDEIIPGFRVFPVLSSIKQDVLTNHYSFGLDWQAVSSLYTSLPEAKKNRVTAHLALTSKNQAKLKANALGVTKESSNFNDFFADREAIEPKAMEYEIPLTLEEERNRLTKYYLEDNRVPDVDDFIGKISFEFDDQNCYIDPFIGAPKFKDATSVTNDNDNVVTVGISDLARAGLKVKIQDKTSNLSQSMRIDKIIAVNEWDKNDECIKQSEIMDEDDIAFKLRQFFENCIITSKCTLTETDDGTNVKCDLYASYANYGQDSNDEFNKHVIYLGEVTKDNLKPSKYLYWQMTESYNKIWSFVHEKTDTTKYENAYNKAKKSLVGQWTYFSVTAALSVAAAVLMFYGPLKITEKMTLGIWIGFSILDIGLATAKTVHWYITDYKKVEGFYNRSKEFAKSEIAQTVLDQLCKDSDTYHIVQASPISPTGHLWSVDKTDFDSQFSYFQQSGQIKYTELVQYNKKFANVLSYPGMNAFLKKQSDLEILESDFAEYQKDWKEDGKHYKIDWALSLFSVVSMAVQTAVVLVQLTALAIHLIKVKFFNAAKKLADESLGIEKQIANNSNEDMKNIKPEDLAGGDTGKKGEESLVSEGNKGEVDVNSNKVVDPKEELLETAEYNTEKVEDLIKQFNKANGLEIDNANNIADNSLPLIDEGTPTVTDVVNQIIGAHPKIKFDSPYVKIEKVRIVIAKRFCARFAPKLANRLEGTFTGSLSEIRYASTIATKLKEFARDIIHPIKGKLADMAKAIDETVLSANGQFEIFVTELGNKSQLLSNQWKKFISDLFAEAIEYACYYGARNSIIFKYPLPKK